MDTLRKQRATGTAEAAENKRLAEAYRNLESAVAQLCGATALMDMAADATITTSDRDLLEGAGLRKDVLPGWRFYALTAEQAEGLHHALNHVRDTVQEFERQYFAAFECSEIAA